MFMFSYREKINHPQACIIPKAIFYNNSFYEGHLSEINTNLMKKKGIELKEYIKEIKRFLYDDKRKKSAWISIAIANQDLDLHTLIDINALIWEGDISHLEAIILSAVPKSVSGLFQCAAALGKLDIINRFATAYSSTALDAIIQEKEFGGGGYTYPAFRLAAENGQLDVINRLVELFPMHVAGMLRATGISGAYAPFYLAAENGLLEVIKRLIDISRHVEFISSIDLIVAGNYAAFRFSARAEHLHIVEYLLSLPVQLYSMLSAKNYDAFNSGSNEIIKILTGVLIEVAPKDLPAMLIAQGKLDTSSRCYGVSNSCRNEALQLILKTDNQTLIDSLLNTPEILSYMKGYEQEYGEQYINPFINRKLEAARYTVRRFMYFSLRVSDYPTLTDAFASIPTGVTLLDLGGNDLDRKTGTELAVAFAGIPAGVTSLHLSRNVLGRKTGAELAQAFAGIPAGVTSLNLGRNDLWKKTGAELAQAFAGIPAGVTSLDLGNNYLYDNAGTQLALAFAGIPAGVTSLDLGRNDLWKKTGAELAVALAGIPRGVTSLDLGRNNLHLKTGVELTVAFAGIPVSVTSLDLGNNYLYRKTDAELAVAFAGIPATVTSLNLGGNDLHLKTGTELAEVFTALPRGITVSFKGDDLFKNKTRPEKDALLIKLRQASVGINLDLSGNGESDAQRALTPLASFAKKPLAKKGVYISTPVLVRILSFLLPEDVSLPKLDKMVVDAAKVVSKRPSMNDSLKIGDAVPLKAPNTYLNIQQIQPDENTLLIEDAKIPHEESIKPQQEFLVHDEQTSPQEENPDENTFLIENAKIPHEESTKLQQEAIVLDEQTSLQEKNNDWLKFMLSLPVMKEVQLAAIVLGAVILLASSGVGMMVLGGGLVTAGAVGLAMNFFPSSSEAKIDTSYDSETPNQTA
jgi:hypothetical protein